MFRQYNSKWVIIISLAAMSFFLYTFTVAKIMLSLSLVRIGSGFFQVYCYIYFPVWVDQFGVNQYKTLFITFLQLGVPLGTMIGYVAEALCINILNNVKSSLMLK